MTVFKSQTILTCSNVVYELSTFIIHHSSSKVVPFCSHFIIETVPILLYFFQFCFMAIKAHWNVCKFSCLFCWTLYTLTFKAIISNFSSYFIINSLLKFCTAIEVSFQLFRRSGQSVERDLLPVLLLSASSACCFMLAWDKSLTVMFSPSECEPNA